MYYDAVTKKERLNASSHTSLLHYASEEASDRFEKFKFSDIGQDKKDNVQAVLKKFRSLCEHICFSNESNYKVNLLNVL